LTNAKIFDNPNMSQLSKIGVGGFMGMNGNYSAGILESVAHYLPKIQQWMKNQ
jgi:hypothetical protein